MGNGPLITRDSAKRAVRFGSFALPRAKIAPEKLGYPRYLGATLLGGSPSPLLLYRAKPRLDLLKPDRNLIPLRAPHTKPLDDREREGTLARLVKDQRPGRDRALDAVDVSDEPPKLPAAQRRCELVLVRLSGATRAQVLGALALESLVTTVAGIVVGVAVVLASLARAGSDPHGGPLVVPWGQAGIVIGGGFALGLIGTLVPAAFIGRARLTALAGLR